MTHDEQRFPGHDGLDLFRQRWLPAGEPVGAVAVLHGIFEHSGRYAHLAEALCNRGYAVYSMDHRGHGRSAGERGHVRRFDDYLADAALLLDGVRREMPGKPIFLFGHSMGAQIAALLVIERQPDLSGLILSGPVVRLGRAVFPVLRFLAAGLSAVWPRLRLVRMGYRNISRDKAVVEAFRNDPLVFHDRFTARIGAEAIRAAARIRQGMHTIRTPMLILHGTADLVADCSGSRLLCRHAGSTDKTLRLYEGLYHEVLSEPEKDAVLSDLLAWLDARTMQRSTKDTKGTK